MLLGLCAALAAAGVFGVAAILQAAGARRVPTMSGTDAGAVRGLVRGLLGQPAFLTALLLNLVGFLLHLAALRLLPLYLAQAGIAASLVVTALLAVRVFGDRLRRVEWAAVAAVFAGLVLLSAAAGATGQQRADAAISLGLFGAIGVVAGAGLVATRADHPAVPAVLGLLAGVGFAGSGVAARVLPSLAPSELWSSAAAYALPISGGLAFLLYSVALQRGRVAAATAPMIVVQTVAPAVVGVLALGDGVRSGLLPVAAVGLLLSTAGAAALARFEAVGHTG